MMGKPAWPLLLLALVLLLAGKAADAAQRHNIIFVLVDDLRFDGMGFLQPEVQTPNIDALAAAGAYFPNAVVTTSLCSPSRATILTGLSTRSHGVVDNNDSSEEGLVFFPQYLQEAGYQTGFFGKWHMGHSSDAPRPGFDRWVSFEGQGAYYPEDAIPPELLAQGVVNQLNVDGKQVPQQGYITDELTDYALDWLDGGRDPSRPFFLYLSHKAVHSDAKPASRHQEQYADTRFSLAPTLKGTAGKPMWVANQRNSWHGIDFFYASDRQMASYLKDYYGALSAVDDSLGRILAYLREEGLADATMVVFYSDNGFLIGDHGLIDKRNAYQGSVRVPMVVAAPGLVPAGKTIDARVRNLDLAPTFLDLAGLPQPPQFEGRSWLPVATGEASKEDWGEPDFVYEYYWEWTFPMTPTTFAIQRGDLKYIQYHGVWDLEELYDLARDPLEEVNLIRDPAYYQQIITLREALYRQLAQQDGKPAVPFTQRLAEGMNLRDRKGPGASPFPAHWLVAPSESPSKYLGLFPDTPMKQRHMQEGSFYFPYMERLPPPAP